MKRKLVIVVTGASGLIGRTLLEEWKNEYRIFAVARRTQLECGAPFHPNIAWMRADISDHDSISEVFREIATASSVDVVFHLAAFYDFSGEHHPEYHTTNVVGTRNVLHLSQEIHPRLLVFSSSVAACPYPAPNEFIREHTPPDGGHIYARSKREGEQLILDPRNPVRSCVVRLGAVYTDWCEYPPLYSMLLTWLSGTWKSRILAGRGESAIPYIHIRDVVSCFRSIIEIADTLPDKTVLQACTNGATSHRTLFQTATRHYYGEEKRPVFMPVFAIAPGLRMLRLIGRMTGNMPFESPWMLRYVDRKLSVDASATYDLLQWSPNTRHAIDRRIRFLLERLKAEPEIWRLKNERASRKGRYRMELRIYQMLSMVEERISAVTIDALFVGRDGERLASLRSMDKNEVTWFVRLLYRLLLTSIQSGNTLLVRDYFEISSAGRFAAGYTPDDLIAVLQVLNKAVLHDAGEWADPRPPRTTLHQCVTMPIEFAIDEIEFQRESGKTAEKPPSSGAEPSSAPDEDVRHQLEETIWKCLVMRK